ncbi:hypothetical protein A3A01_01560 [Candidatus Nomurabacteria bacterium RIFCSPLOWO2_01_FULL_39_17]|uniref:Type II secretion system protein GspI C-terminal domain-containing protein n=1 Tax=Candidatus Nomurabacteria bacterium RIFCSPLOWO2_01_FULL_39_17 TaxID=1801770 RepID=A0A1F6WWA1_9BACT|nr:MAG: hypothetical protein A3A01_01560 [Candidatus Nomurabacteria bacterium RIFCSPLOWO2_01_FULL_39_17]
MKINRDLKSFFQQGSLMVEVIVVVSIVTVSILVALTVAQKSIYLARQSLHHSQSAFLLEEGAEAVKVIRDNAWSGISSLTLSTDYYLSFSGDTWTLSTTPSQVGAFTRRIVFSSAYRDANQDLAPSGTLDDQTRLVTVTVSWTEGAQTLSKTLQFYLTDLFS